MSAAEINTEDLVVVVTEKIADDLRRALEANFPHEQLPDWARIALSIKSGNVIVHELRCKSDHLLLAARLVARFPSRFRGDPCFMSIAWVVTPKGDGDSKRGIGKGYGAHLSKRSHEICRYQMPNAFGFLSERGRNNIQVANQEQPEHQARSQRLGRTMVEDLDYEIPPMPKYIANDTKQQPVSDRVGSAKPGTLLINRYDGALTIDGDTLYKIIERLYTDGYDISKTDPYLQSRLSLIDKAKTYNLVSI